MVIFFKMCRNFSYLKYRNKLGSLVSPYRTTMSQRLIHQSVKLNVKMFMEYENQYAYDIMTNRGYGVCLTLGSRETLLTKEQFDQLMARNWFELTPQELFNIFPKLGVYCKENNLCISDKIFDQYIDALTDNMKHAADHELTSLFYSLKQWPDTPSIRTRNFIEVWAALDDECLTRIPKWSFDEMLLHLALFYNLNVSRFSDFSHKCLHRLASKAKQLTPAQIVQSMFFIGILRKSPFDVHNLEVCVDNWFTEFSIEELGILSMGFFKSKTPIKNIELVSKMIDKVIENSKQINEVSFAAMLKVIRYSMKYNTDDKIYQMLDVLQQEAPRLSVMCNVHLALVGTSTLTFHADCLTKIAETINSNISKTRLKDLERLILTYGMFNFKPKTKVCLFSNVINELRRNERNDEINRYGRSFICCIGFLGLLEYYPIDLINRALCPEFLEITYGKPYAYGREVLVVNNRAQIFCKELKVNLLVDKSVRIISKKYTEYVPSEEFSKEYNVTEKMFIDVTKILKESRGGPDYVTGNHILSHHQRGDIIICNDSHGMPLRVNETFETRLFGIIYPPPDENKWIVLVIAGRNVIIPKSNLPNGHYQTKVRELNALGYHAALVKWSDYSMCKSREEKLDYISKLIENVTNSKVK